MPESDRIVVRPDYSLRRRLFGLPFALGAFVFFGLPLRQGAGLEEGLIMAFIAGFVFLGVGLWILARRTGVLLDLARNELITIGGLVRARETRHDLAGFDTVALTREERSSSSGRDNTHTTVTVHPVRLTGPGASVLLVEHRQRAPAYEAAELYARLMHKRLVDTSGGRRIEREADALDESLQDQLRAEPAALDEGPAPGDGTEKYDALPARMQANMRIGVEPVVRREGEELAYHIPPMGLRKQHLGPPLLVLALGGAPSLLLLWCAPPFGLGLIGLALLGAALALLPWREQIQRAQVVRLLPGALQVYARGREVRLPFDQIVDLHVAPLTGPPGHFTLVGGGVIVADTGRDRIWFGEALSREDLQDLYRTLRAYMVDREAVLARFP